MPHDLPEGWAESLADDEVGFLYGALGPLAASVLFDATGAYLAAWLLMIAVYAAVLVSREPPPKVAPDAGEAAVGVG